MRPVALLLVLLGCVGPEPVAGPDGGPSGSSGPAIPDADLRVLFVGNSLTASNDLTGMVQALADSDGRSFAHASVVRPNWSLQEHWAAGIGDVIARERPDVVVLQQGPSSLPESREHLVHWTSRLAPVIRDAGGRTALFMVWPAEDRRAFFGDVRDSYRAAADAVDGLFIPAGVTWLEAWEREPDIPLYGPDRFHPSTLGSLAAALTIYAALYDLDADALPARLTGATAEQAAVLRDAVAASLAAR